MSFSCNWDNLSKVKTTISFFAVNCVHTTNMHCNSAKCDIILEMRLYIYWTEEIQHTSCPQFHYHDHLTLLPWMCLLGSGRVALHHNCWYYCTSCSGKKNQSIPVCISIMISIPIVTQEVRPAKVVLSTEVRIIQRNCICVRIQTALGNGVLTVLRFTKIAESTISACSNTAPGPKR